MTFKPNYPAMTLLSHSAPTSPVAYWTQATWTSCQHFTQTGKYTLNSPLISIITTANLPGIFNHTPYSKISPRLFLLILCVSCIHFPSPGQLPLQLFQPLLHGLLKIFPKFPSSGSLSTNPSIPLLSQINLSKHCFHHEPTPALKPIITGKKLTIQTSILGHPQSGSLSPTVHSSPLQSKVKWK